MSVSGSTISNVVSTVINSFKDNSLYTEKLENPDCKSSCNTLPRMNRTTQGPKSGTFESHGSKPAPTSPIRKSNELLNDIMTVMDDASCSASVSDINSIRSSRCSTGSINDSGSSNSIPHSPTSRYASPDWTTKQCSKPHSRSLGRSTSHLPMTVSSGTLTSFVESDDEPSGVSPVPGMFETLSGGLFISPIEEQKM